MRYLLDAKAVIALLNDPGGSVDRRIRELKPEDVGLSAIALHEFYYGAFKSVRRDRNLALVDGILFEMIEFDREDSRHAGEIRAALARLGTPIGSYDVLIAGQARARDLTLVTANASEFRRVDGLRIEDWSVEAWGASAQATGGSSRLVLVAPAKIPAPTSTSMITPIQRGGTPSRFAPNAIPATKIT